MSKRLLLAALAFCALAAFAESALEAAASAVGAVSAPETNAAPAAAVKPGDLAPPEPPHENPRNYDDLEGEEGLYWGDWDGSVMGRVIDKQRKPIPFAKVKVHSKDLETIADKDGYFQIDGLQVGGHYSLIISARGKEPGVARWIPIPVRKVARIGDFSVEPEKVWTNFWVVSTSTSVVTELDALSNAVERTVTSCISNYYDIVEGQTNIYDYSQWYFRFHLSYYERRILEKLGITNVPAAKAELVRRSLGFDESGRPIEPALPAEEKQEEQPAQEDKAEE